MFFSEQRVDALIEVIKGFESVEARFDPGFIWSQVQCFDVSRFQAQMHAFVSEKLDDFRKRAGLGQLFRGIPVLEREG